MQPVLNDSTERAALAAARKASEASKGVLANAAAQLKRAQDAVEGAKSQLAEENQRRAAAQIAKARQIEEQIRLGKPTSSKEAVDDCMLQPLDANNALVGHPAVRALASITDAHRQAQDTVSRTDEALASAIVAVMRLDAAALIARARAIKDEEQMIRVKLLAYKQACPRALVEPIDWLLSANEDRNAHQENLAVLAESTRLRERMQALIEGGQEPDNVSEASQ